MTIRSARDAESILRGMQARLVTNLMESLAEAFLEKESRLPLIVLCNYIAGAQLSLIEWWMLNRTDYGTRHIAHMIQRLQFAAIKDAYQLD